MAETPAQPLSQPSGQPGGQSGARREVRRQARTGRETAGREGSTPAGAEVRLRRAGSPPSPRRRASSADDFRYSLASRLTERDRSLLRELDRHGVLTSGQIAAMFFGSESRARARLVALHESLAVVARFRPHSPAWGSAQFHYTLNRRGAGVVAAERGDDPAVAERRWAKGRMLALAGSQRLRHTVGINGFYAALVAEARRNPAAELLRWLTEAEAAAACGSTGWSPRSSVRPDGWGLWAEGGERVGFFLEYDRGTEPLNRLAAKLRDYERLESERGAAAWVLFAFESARREHSARRALAGATVAAALDGAVAPSEAVWLPLRASGAGRVRLAALACVPKPAEALARAEAGGGRAWRYPHFGDDAGDEGGDEAPDLWGSDGEDDEPW